MVGGVSRLVQNSAVWAAVIVSCVACYRKGERLVARVCLSRKFIWELEESKKKFRALNEFRLAQISAHTSPHT